MDVVQPLMGVGLSDLWQSGLEGMQKVISAVKILSDQIKHDTIVLLKPLLINVYMVVPPKVLLLVLLDFLVI